MMAGVEGSKLQHLWWWQRGLCRERTMGYCHMVAICNSLDGRRPANLQTALVPYGSIADESWQVGTVFAAMAMSR
jgi:hypothetical protein